MKHKEAQFKQKKHSVPLSVKGHHSKSPAPYARDSNHHAARYMSRPMPGGVIYTSMVKSRPHLLSFGVVSSDNVILAPKETGHLTCEVDGNPKPSVAWSINGIPIENSHDDPTRKVTDGIITLSDVQVGSSAVYQCNASNEYGYLLANAFVSVLAEPPRVLTPPNHVYSVITNSKALLDCFSFGSPLPKITWFKDSQRIQNGDSYHIHANGTLEIHVAQKLNSGKYTCMATNNLGIKENSVSLKVKGEEQLC
ncbi:hypothetical protein DNTS_006120 [Danionella cerebrum]|uniref:Ig-like domain-containing protein n=1 Tax=Danionella cerebrum TaxID=2873325 RepID=A0A553NRB0_9TELE|nr:hypothetical protein DNTS_006120 [Danionella translucida]TRY67970.1 hypothetical protein DNTS_006120 [Danionella translucida]TRY67971.1 hypothetical protein DNTS_006120 [Danionella translucida]